MQYIKGVVGYIVKVLLFLERNICCMKMYKKRFFCFYKKLCFSTFLKHSEKRLKIRLFWVFYFLKIANEKHVFLKKKKTKKTLIFKRFFQHLKKRFKTRISCENKNHLFQAIIQQKNILRRSTRDKNYCMLLYKKIKTLT